MSQFKEIIQTDLAETFIDIDDFGDIHNVNNANIPIVVDTDALVRNQLKDVKGVYTGTILFYVRAADYGDPPRPGSRITIDDAMYNVVSCNGDMGMYTITGDEVRA